MDTFRDDEKEIDEYYMYACMYICIHIFVYLCVNYIYIYIQMKIHVCRERERLTETKRGNQLPYVHMHLDALATCIDLCCTMIGSYKWPHRVYPKKIQATHIKRYTQTHASRQTERQSMSQSCSNTDVRCKHCSSVLLSMPAESLIRKTMPGMKHLLQTNIA